MPAKFKPSEKEYIKNKDGRRTDRWRWKHYYCKQTSTEDLIKAINTGKPKHKQKFIIINPIVYI